MSIVSNNSNNIIISQQQVMIMWSKVAPPSPIVVKIGTKSGK